MSLINDALKRAKQQQRKSSAPGPPLAPVPPVQNPPLMPVRPSESGHRWQWFFGVVITLLLFCAGSLIVIALWQKSETHVAIVNSPANSGFPSTSPVAATSQPAAAVAPAIVAAATRVVLPPPVPPSTAPVSVAVAPVKPVAPILQGIFYDPIHPRAVVSGKTVHVGSVIHGFKVESISPTVIMLMGPDQKEISMTIDQ